MNTINKEKGASIADFLREKSVSIVAPLQYAVIKENLNRLKIFTDEETKALEDYMLEF